jgi:hypothetical protein
MVFNSSAQRGSSHNLIVGPEHTYSSYGGLVAGWYNAVTAAFTSVSGGEQNTASGGSGNLVNGNYATVSGGGANTAFGEEASVSGGQNNTAELDEWIGCSTVSGY